MLANHKALTALCLAFAFMMTIFVIPSSVADEAPMGSEDNPYSFKMFVGETFVYHPYTSLSAAVIAVGDDSTIASGTGSSRWIDLTADDNAQDYKEKYTLSGTANDAAQAQGHSKIHLTARHTAGTLVQTADQWIDILVEKHTVVNMASPSGVCQVGSDDYTRSFTVSTQNSASVSWKVVIDGNTFTQSNIPAWIDYGFDSNSGAGYLKFLCSEMDSSFANKYVEAQIIAADSINGDSYTEDFSFYIYNDSIALTPDVMELTFDAGDEFPGDHSVTVRDIHGNALDWEMISVTGTGSVESDWSIDNGTLTYANDSLPTSTDLETRYGVTWTIIVRATLTADPTQTADCRFVITILPDVSGIANSMGYILVDAKDSMTAVCHNTTKGSESCLWNFGDGSKLITKNEALPHKYGERGLYDIVQTAYYPSGFAFNSAHYFFSAGNTFTGGEEATQPVGNPDSIIKMDGRGIGTALFFGLTIIAGVLAYAVNPRFIYLVPVFIAASILFMFVSIDLGPFKL
ncbi:MAG: hypothetical protein IJT54_02700 [Candidatus Methanomethylophilaceae archaeon]|nr:hypothetical protein [Candidatus Methanomethylophilaceae archaeon]